jgi:uncharacterized protein YukE
MEDFMLRLNTDELLNITKKMDQTNIEIASTINNIVRINNNLSYIWKDETSKDFVNNFGSYINDLKGVIDSNKELLGKINKFAVTYEITDIDLAKKLRSEVNADE